MASLVPSSCACGASSSAAPISPASEIRGLGDGGSALPQGLPTRIKLVMLGATGVGKSCLALRFAKGVFAPAAPTIGAAFLSRTATLPSGLRLRYEIWDTAGQERYQSLAPLYYRGAQAAAVVYDITSRESFDKVRYWAAQLAAHAPPDMVVVLVGNKSDLCAQRAVKEEEGRDLADSAGYLFLEASALSGANVADVFEGLAEQLAGGLPLSTPAEQPPLAEPYGVAAG
uniref:Uncharacterized protein n=1 Tax=Chlamydomonas leiostraca TaxID=1034604 RepID=A0A7S0RKD6_9CHLO|mmetsp:Transcript_24890/g.63139  ORF Transcript_24890/g.63139 Transcript_24890/m.63139 type:complete len:229 (+) Transcript_24890:279-965(+)